MQWTCAEWVKCSASIIYSCFVHCHKQTFDFATDTKKEINKNVLQNIDQYAPEHGVHFLRAALSSLFNRADKNDVLLEINWNDLVWEVAGLPELTATDSDDKEKDKSEEVNSVVEKLDALSVVKAALERHASLTLDILKAF